MVEQGLVGNEVEVVAVGDLVPADNLAYLLKYDSTQGAFKGEVTHKDDETLVVDGADIKVVKAPSPAELPWKELGVDVVIDPPASSPMARNPRATSRPARKK